MIINSETDYAIRIVSCLADCENKLDAGTIAERTGVTPRYALKILRKLSVGGIVKSYKGAKGGYALSRKAEDITLLEVIELICGTINFSRCQCEQSVCTHPQGECLFKETFNGVTEFMRREFKNATFGRKEY